MNDRYLRPLRDLAEYRLVVEQRDRSPDGYGDAEFMRLFGRYLQSKEAFRHELDLALQRLQHPPETRGPRRLQLDAPVHSLFFLRRMLEDDARAYFSYRPGLHLARQPRTWRSDARGHAKDASLAQLVGRDDRESDAITDLLDGVEAHCKKLYDEYQQTEDPIPDGLLRRIIATGELIDASGAEEIGEFSGYIKRIINEELDRGRLKGAWAPGAKGSR